MRRIIILALLFAGMQMILPLGERGHGAQSLLTFGFLILAADAVGYLASRARLPKIVGYLIAGIVFGPSVFNTVTADAMRELAPVSSLAIALIAFLAGAELRLEELRTLGGRIMKILATELTFSLVAVTAFLFILREYVPFLQGVPLGPTIAFSILFASMVMVHSPAVTMALLTETKANGPVARTTLGVVLISDVVVVLSFTAALALARAIVPPTVAEASGVSLGSVVWEILGAILFGAILGGAVSLYLRWIRRELFLFAIMVAFFGAEVARLGHVEVLLTLLTAGFVTENVSRPRHGRALRRAMERSAAPVFVVFFALAGASMHLSEVRELWPLVVPIVAIRLLAIWAGTNVGSRWGGGTEVERKNVWMGLVSQAGVAIGLATVVAQAYPTRGAELRTLFLAVIAVNESIGPVLFRFALSRSKELGEPDGKSRIPPEASEGVPLAAET